MFGGAELVHLTLDLQQNVVSEHWLPIVAVLGLKMKCDDNPT